MFRATQEIVDTFEEKGIKFDVSDGERNSAVTARFRSSAGSVVSIRFISTDDDNDVAVRAFDLSSVPEEKKDAVLPVLNDLNHRYRYAKFVLDDDNDVCVEYDLPQRGEAVGEACAELFLRLMRIINDSAPEIMRAIWA